MRTLVVRARMGTEGFRRAVMRRRFRAALRPDDVLLVSYPRSGMTWLSFMLANAIRPDLRDEINVATHHEHVPDVNDEYFWGKGTLERFAGLPQPRFFCLHAVYDPAFTKVVYVLRDPRDSLVSQYHLQRLENASFDRSLREFVTADGHWPCGWDEHVSGWLFRPRSSALVIRYEEMRTDPASAVAQVLEFAGLEPDPETVRSAVEAGAFERMRRLEEQFGPLWPGSGPERTVRRGRIGGWREELDEESLRALEAKYGWVMDRIGYERYAP